MTEIESLTKINRLKIFAIFSGGFKKHTKPLLRACNEHLDKFGVDLTPPQLLEKK